MVFSWFLKLSFKCPHHFAWPLAALVYPMWASVQAFETDSNAETKNLISYWILLSLLYLFEYAFMSLLPWFRLWLCVKLMIIFLLTIPDFGRASYVYNNCIRPMKLQIVQWRFNNFWRKCFIEKDDFLMHAERYMRENGTEALEKLIASQNTMCRPDVEVANEIIATDDKNVLKVEFLMELGLVQTNGESLQIEHLDIRDLEAIEKKEIPFTKQDIPVMPKVGLSHNASSATVETKGTAESDRTDRDVPQITSIPKEMQKEWTCALCLVTTTSEITLNSHLSGRRHRAAAEALIAKKLLTIQKQKGVEVTNEIIFTDNKEMMKINGNQRLEIDNKDIKDLEAIEKKEIHATKQICGVSDSVRFCGGRSALAATRYQQRFI
ncbi:uncharacterized protein LOC131620291 [Vicia villosa]|uniref:uncharacterized protein LOC131620291 n=1 Tax=Vicia villosa TaxID=3911 RepID=UPI00273C3927|nr:uncharacterized protein LOC131620291 [Vicia villosa]